jgi:hypothetical protein
MPTMANDRFYYKILLESMPGGGKTYSTRNLPRKTTGFINVEAKPLPFKGSFDHMTVPEKYQDILDKLAEFSRSPEITTIVFDSLSAAIDMALQELRASGLKGFDLWAAYNDRVGMLLNFIKRVKKDVVVIGHYEILSGEDGSERRLKVKGKEWEGVVEKEFTIVLFADHLRPDDKGGRGEFCFWLSKPGTSAKCPPDIMGEEVLRIPNDMALFYNKLYEFLGIPPLVPAPAAAKTEVTTIGGKVKAAA